MDERDLKAELLTALREVEPKTAGVEYDKLADRFELTWKDKIAFVSRAKVGRYFATNTIPVLVTGLMRVANEKHPITPNQPQYGRHEVLLIIEERYRKLLRAAGLPEIALPGDTADAIVELEERISTALSREHKESCTNE